MKQAKVKVLLRTDKPSSNGSLPIYLRITHLRKSSYISIGYSCLPEEWNSETLRLYETIPKITQSIKEELNTSEINNLKKLYSTIKINPLAAKINAEIARSIRNIEGENDRLAVNDEVLSSVILKRSIRPTEEGNSNKSFIKYWEKQLEYIKASEVHSTYKTYLSILKIFQVEFMKNKDLIFDEINVDFLKKYKTFLKGYGYSDTTLHNHLKTFKSILYKAIKEPEKKYFSQHNNPFFNFELKPGKPKRKERLNSDEIKTLETFELAAGSRINDARNMFLFSFYCAGIRIGDLLQLTWSNIQEGRLCYTMGKSNKDRSIKLLPKALQILKIYFNKDQKPEDYIFPLLRQDLNKSNKVFLRKQVESKTSLINSCLKDLAEKAEIKKNLSSHISRHSFADIARQKKISIRDIQILLSHSDSKTTEIYLNSLDLVSQDEAHENVFN